MDKPKQPSKRLPDLLAFYRTSKRLIQVLWRIDKKLFLGSLIAIVIPGIIPFINAYIYALIINYIVALLAGHPADQTYLLTLIGARVVSLFVQDAAFGLQRYYELLMWTKLPTTLFQDVLTKLSSLDLEYFENSSFKDMLEKVRESYTWRPINMMSQLFYATQSLVQLSIAAVAIVTLNWVFAVIILLVSIPTFLQQAKYADTTWTVWDDNSPHRKRIWYLSDLVQHGQSVKEVKLFQLAKTFLDELRHINQRFVAENVRVARKQYLSSLGLSFLNVGAYAAMEVYIIFATINRRLSLGGLTYYTTVITNFQAGANGLFRNLSMAFEQSQYTAVLFEILDTETKIPQPTNPIKLETIDAPRIEFRNVSFTYPGSTHKVLDDFSLVIEPGQKVAFVGENGAGKTTIVKLLGRFYDVDEGEILIDGINLKQLDLQSWYDRLGVLFQDFIKYEYSLRENIRFGDTKARDDLEAIVQAAKQSGADAVADQLPKGYEQMLGRTFSGGIDLSAGQWQKVALGRGFFRNSSVLVLDEPTAAIDAKAEHEIFGRVERLAKDKTVLIISHRFSTVRNADVIYVLEHGKIKEQGSHERLMKDDGVYASLFRVQAKGYQ